METYNYIPLNVTHLSAVQSTDNNSCVGAAKWAVCALSNPALDTSAVKNVWHTATIQHYRVHVVRDFRPRFFSELWKRHVNILCANRTLWQPSKSVIVANLDCCETKTGRLRYNGTEISMWSCEREAHLDASNDRDHPGCRWPVSEVDDDGTLLWKSRGDKLWVFGKIHNLRTG